MTMSNGHLNVKWPFWPRYPGFYSLETITVSHSRGERVHWVHWVRWVHWIQWSMTMSNGHLNVKWQFWPRYPGFYSLETITQPRRTCSLGSLGSLDPMVNGNVQWTFECEMAMLTALSWVLLTGDYDTAQQSVFIGFIGFIGPNGQ